MNTPWLHSLQPFPRILFTILLIISCFFLFFLAALLLAIPVYQVGFSGILELLGDYTNPKAVSLLKFFQVVQQVGLFVVPPLLAAFLFSGQPFRFLGLQRPSRWVFWALTAILMVVSAPFIDQLIRWNETMQLPGWMGGMERWMQETEQQAKELTEAFLNVKSAGGFALNLVMIALLPAIGEEMLFRGMFQRLLNDWLHNVHLAILIAGILFGAMHLQFYGILPRALLGILFGYLFWWSGSLWIPIFAHFLNNAVAVIIHFLYQQGMIDTSLEEFGTSDNLLVIIASLALTAWVLFYFRYLTTKESRKTL